MNVTTDPIWPWMALLSKKTFDRDENVDVVASEPEYATLLFTD